MSAPSRPRRLARPARGAAPQRGSFLLEALISVLIVALAILGLMGLMARGLQDVDESKMRGEAAFLATSYIGLMWVDDRTTLNLQAKFGPGGAEYVNLQTMLAQRLPNAVLKTVNIVPGATANSTEVEIDIQWTPPGLNVATAPQAFHRYQAFAVIGANN
jgi:hypothetical protein